MVIGKTLIKDHTKPNTDLGKVFSEENELLCGSNNEGLFITAFEGILDLMTGEFRFVNAGHEFYDMQRLTDILIRNTAKPPAELLSAVKADIDAFVGKAPQFDDITMLCVEYLHRSDPTSPYVSTNS